MIFVTKHSDKQAFGGGWLNARNWLRTFPGQAKEDRAYLSCTRDVGTSVGDVSPAPRGLGWSWPRRGRCDKNHIVDTTSVVRDNV